MNGDEIRQLERASIRAFVEASAELFSGTVLDYGCGLQPYRDVVEVAGGLYIAYDRVGYPANVSGENIGQDDPLASRYQAVLCTQVIQYWPEPYETLLALCAALYDGGHLVITGPTNWPEVEGDDLFRYTQAGVEKLLRWAGFDIVRLEQRATVEVGPGFTLSLGWGAVGRA